MENLLRAILEGGRSGPRRNLELQTEVYKIDEGENRSRAKAVVQRSVLNLQALFKD